MSSKRETVYPAEKARQGDIVLRHKGERVIFIVGLAAPIVIALVLLLLYAQHWF
ncbi:MAG: peptide ABC transporter permease [Devosia sp.]|jgi:hypothetical protein|nr:hypothetical protein [Devosiaceae bacterium]